MKKLLIVIAIKVSCILLSYVFAIGQNAPGIAWQRIIGGSLHDEAFSIKQTSDGGYIVGGGSVSNDIDVSGNHGVKDCWIAKLNTMGQIEWSKSYGGSFTDYTQSIIQTFDGGYIFSANTSSNDGDVIGNHGSFDTWVVKIDSIGNIQWQRCLGGSNGEEQSFIQQTSDSGYVLIGNTYSNDGDVSGNHGLTDVWVVKLSSNGFIQWQNCIGSTGNDVGYALQQTPDNGFILAARDGGINNGDVFGGLGGGDFWIIKLSSNGIIQWQKCLGGSNNDTPQSIKLTNDGGYIIAGNTFSTDGYVTGNHGGTSGPLDIWIIKIDSIGNMQWQKCLGGSNNEAATTIEQTLDGGYAVAGWSDSNNGDINGLHGYRDLWIAKLDNLGNLNWQKPLGGSLNDDLNELASTFTFQQTVDSGYIITGSTRSIDGDLTNNYGDLDIWVVKLLTSTVNFMPNSNFTAQTTTACINSCITFSNTSTNDSTWLWLFPGGNPSSSSLKNPPPICYSTSGSYSVTLITSNSLGTDTLTINNFITVNPTPNVQVFTDSVICVGDTISLSATGGATYQWAGPNNFNSSSPTPSILNASSSNSGTYTVIGTNNFGCTDTTTIQISVSPSIPIQASSNSPICEGSALNLSSSAGSQYLWSGPNGFTSTAQNPVISSTALQNSGSYSVTVTNVCGTSTVSINAIVNASPIALIATTDTVLCENDTLNLLGSGIGAFLWTGPSGFSSNQQNNTLTNLTSSNTGFYTLIVTNTQGCSDTASVFVKTGESDCFFIPSVFTPNGDGINDTWVIEGLSEFPNCLVRVFNRWGQLLFDNKGYAQPWDGVYDGNQCPIADYYYIIDLGTDKKTFTGTVTIKR